MSQSGDLSRGGESNGFMGMPGGTRGEGGTGGEGAAAMSPEPVTDQQQFEALQKVQAQAQQRVKLSMQLLKAAESRVALHTDVLGQLKIEQSQLREQVNEDVTKSLHQYDQWIGQIDEHFTDALRALEQRMDAMQAEWSQSRERLDGMMSRSEALLDQSRYLLAAADSGPAGKSRAGPKRTVRRQNEPLSEPAAPAEPPPSEVAPLAAGDEIYSKLIRQLRDADPPTSDPLDSEADEAA